MINDNDSRLRRADQTLLYSLLGLCTDDSINQLSIFEDEHGWYARNLVLRSRSGILIHVQLSYAITTLRLSGELIQDGSNYAAWTAPGSPTIEQNRRTICL